MKKIYKWKVIGDDTLIEAPVEKWLDAQLQNGTLVVWAIVDFDQPEQEYYIYTLGTGWSCKRIPGTYIGTVQEGGYVEHVFAARVTRPENVDCNWGDPDQEGVGFYVS